MFKFDKELLFAVTPNLQWTTGTVNFDQPNVKAALDNGQIIEGTLNQTTCTIDWSTPVATWLKIPALKQVHVVFMNHLDVGYNGIPKTGFINNVLNTYFEEYFPRAIRLGNEMKETDPDHGFIYTTHPWLLDMYLNCPKHFTLNDIKLYCPTNDEIEAMEKAIQDGLITWHAGPMNMQIELMNKHLLNASMQISRQLDTRFGHKSTVLSQRDVPGLTAGAIATLVNECGVRGVTVGVNPGSSPPAVPKIFQWKLHEESSESLIAMWHPGGYPTNPGPSLSKAGGLSLMDSTIAEDDGQALVFAFRTDNSGPPLSLDEIHTAFDILERQFEGAKVFASTLDNFVNSVTKESLTTVVGEIGDTWIQGIAADPHKMALYRYGAKALQICVENKECELDFETIEYLRFLVKLPEHTWGLPSVYDTGNWTNSNFDKYRNQANFQNGEFSWSEQRVFFNTTVEMSRNAKNTNYYKHLETLLTQDGLQPYPKVLKRYMKIDMYKPHTMLVAGIPGNITFGLDGSISSIIVKDESNTVHTLVDKDHTIGTFTYHTYNQSDYDFANAEYGYYGNAGYNKPNVTNSAHPQSGINHMTMVELYQSIDIPVFCAKLIPTMELKEKYGAPTLVWNCVAIGINPNGNAFPLQLDFKVSILEKRATRLPEAMMYSFTPTPQTAKQWSHQLFKVEPYTGKDSVPSGGITLDSIVQNGSFYQHAVEELYLIDPEDKFVFKAESLEVPLVCPIFSSTTGFTTPNPLPILSRPDPLSMLKGFAFNIHNNVWNTNYPLWYPFENEDRNFRANFVVQWDKQ